MNFAELGKLINKMLYLTAVLYELPTVQEILKSRESLNALRLNDLEDRLSYTERQ